MLLRSKNKVANLSDSDGESDNHLSRFRRKERLSNKGHLPITAGSSSCSGRQRVVSKRLQVMSESESSEEMKETATPDDYSSDGSVDPVERIHEMNNLPVVIVQVRRLTAQLSDVCNELEQMLMGEGPDEKTQMEELKQKLVNLGAQCQQESSKVRKITVKRGKQPTKKRKEVVHQDSDTVFPQNVSRIRTNSVDYTDYPAADVSRINGEVDTKLPNKNTDQPIPTVESTKDSGIPCSGQDESNALEEMRETDSPAVLRDDPFEDINSQIHDITDPQESLVNAGNIGSTDTFGKGCAQEEETCSEAVDSAINDDIFCVKSDDIDAGDDQDVQFLSATAPRRTGKGQERVKQETDIESYYQPNPASSKMLDVKLVPKLKSVDSKFITKFDPNPNREPTKEEIRYIVPHQPKFSVYHQAQGENLELSLMKKEIEMRLRVNELSWVTQRAVRDESSRMKKVNKNNDELKRQLQRYEHKLPPNQLILDYDKEKKTFIRVHPGLATKMKPHQKEGVKFMYDCCYGGVSDVKNSKGSGCILAHCMGLGKTLQVIALINTVISYPQMQTKRIIVVCPKSTVMNWAQEFREWLGDVDSEIHLQVTYFPDSSNIYKKLEVLRNFHQVTGKNANCLLIGYEAYRSLVFYDSKNRNGEQQSDRIRAEVRRVLINPGADLIILDEGHIIKNRKSQTNLAIAEVATRRRIILTGTPIQNNLNEYFCMVSFVKPAFLGNEKEFNEHYAKPIKDGQHKDSNPVEIKYMKTKSFILHKLLADFVQRKEFSVLKEFLPKKYEYVLYVPLTPVQEDLYEEYLRRYPFQRDVGGLNLLEDYTFLRKIWTHPIVLERAWEVAMKKKYGVQEKRRAIRQARGFDSSSDDEDDNDEDQTRSITNVWWKQIISADDLESLFPSNKMLLLFEILKMCQERGEKCLIFSGFVMVLNMVEHFMRKIDEQDKNPKANLYGLSRFRGPWRPGMDFYRIDGGTAKSTRHEMVTKFNDPKNHVTRVFLISTKAGGQGINLVGANRVIILDTSWNPAVDQQGIFRIYRLGQRKTCYIYRLLAIHTMEEKVYSRAVTKQAMSHRVADKKQVDRNYNMAELEELYHFERVDMGAREDPAPAEDDLLSALLWKHHNLIYRYHTHEMMLDNKNEKDLTELEKKFAWAEFKKKGLSSLYLGIDSQPLTQMSSTVSQQFDLDGDLFFDRLFGNSCVQDQSELKPSIADTSLKSSITPPEPLTVNTSDAEVIGDDSIIFGEDPYKDSSVGGMSIIEEQRRMLGIKKEPKAEKPAQVTVTEEEANLLRELEENTKLDATARVKLDTPEVAKVAACQTPFIDTSDLLNLSYDGDHDRFQPDSQDVQIQPECNDFPPESNTSSTEPTCSELVPTTSDVTNTKDNSFSSLIEYDPVGDSQEIRAMTAAGNNFPSNNNGSLIVPPSYETFVSNMNNDCKTVTSTVKPPVVLDAVAASTPGVMATAIEPRMTRAMKRKTVSAPKVTVRSKRNRV
ncbi:transcriptional regulator ATRX homolog [Topomyia yanbarensis]|uniref:transcriptional regulator ATRX homolog n=1 Tax=Topomyia yanbarensis TaxID=2498891 RepID=UPI00273CA4CA|nr:transcriptional regulator ATRX homolog [Topomyia yanbarensis]